MRCFCRTAVDSVTIAVINTILTTAGASHDGQVLFRQVSSPLCRAEYSPRDLLAGIHPLFLEGYV